MNPSPRPPTKKFQVIVAYGPYRKGDVIQPTGLYRDTLLHRGIIREIKIDPDAVPLVNRQVEIEDLVQRAAPAAGSRQSPRQRK